jgi:hypothetical protein
MKHFQGVASNRKLTIHSPGIKVAAGGAPFKKLLSFFAQNPARL